MVNKSIWSLSASTERRETLKGTITTDTAIIGGGLAGVLTAHFLEQAGRNCVILEAARIGSGQTKNTTAKVTSQHGPIYGKLIESVGKEKAGQYAAANQEAIRRYKILVDKYQIDCEWKDCPAYLYTATHTRKIREEYEAVKRLGIPAELTEKTELHCPVKLALKFKDQGRFHPLKFLYKMAEGLQIYENTKVKDVKENVVITDQGEVHAEQIVFACHYPFLNVPGYYFMRMHQERSYVVSVKHADMMEGMYYGIDSDALSYRSAGEVLLVGGGGHRTGKAPTGDPYEYLAHMAESYWPDCVETARWSAQDCMTLDHIPYIGQFSHSRPNWYVATGFGKWGMTSSMVSAMILTDLICKRENPYAEVFSPLRYNVQASAGNFIKDSGHAAAGLLKRAVWIPQEKLEQVHAGEGAVVEHEGHKYGVYKSETGEIYAVSAHCPHLGCQLEWNAHEKSWDCPCHGSRFDYRGRHLDEPAQEDILCRKKEGK
ncbi:MAG: FAD-dependent oxidoreductase [Faecalicatena sp.]|uniref:FAD-dependent oxidoreductase n=1 Tax=Faecalicatena sp. TaxID=2005360 RepID=UPI00258B92FA|nr:FAD-dependent oxidoreductase [Faecalicatena sp.]MCI6466694.1 FAD-dependent oxidoreductase [Faecalicatena sp.]MDY5620668.1 FAD-dependent oxidoreductase [Lachnospiraceae bacterium]